MQIIILPPYVNTLNESFNPGFIYLWRLLKSKESR